MRPDADSQPGNSPARFQFSLPALAFIAAAVVLTALPFGEALTRLFDVWNLQPEYSHGILIPLISLFLLWRQRHVLERTPFKGSWTGLLLVAAGLALWLIGELSTIYVIVQYSFLVVLYGLVATLIGWRVFRQLWMPLLILIFMIPLPAFFSNTLSLNLQLLSSSLGVLIIRLFGISVFLEGNVIDLGVYQLQVAEACDGLRYLFPLMTLAFVVSYFFRASLWKRIVLFASSIPIAILMNSLRIGLIGVTVEHWGVQMAEGILHDFEGWVVFMVSTVALMGVAALLARMGPSPQKLKDALTFDLGAPVAPSKEAPAPATRRSLPQAFIAATVLVSMASIVAFVLPVRLGEATPARDALVSFPGQLGEWQGRRSAIENLYLDELKLDDYLMANYSKAGAAAVNLYVAYYDSQRKGHSVHSPRSCMPGGGWVIRDIRETTLKAGARDVPVNRALIELGDQKQLVYYWFQQRGRTITNEYVVKWYIFWDALTRNRTDGALVRLVVPLPRNMTEAQADEQLGQFAELAVPLLTQYVPD
jgi:exosortase D (VPLPA-CTERM-specific)